MSTEKPAATKPDHVLDTPWEFTLIIQGAVECPDEETVRAYCLASVSLTAAFSQFVGHMRVAVRPQQLNQELFDANGVKIKPM